MAMKKKDILRTGREVLEAEAEAVKAMAAGLDENFVLAVDLLDRSTSRVIITGMGKSGIVGRKIAATLSSCGTPALFIHPAEAGHGDLGMIVKDDVLVAISHSGETREILQLLDFVKRIGIKLIGITGNPSSRLAKYSDVVLETRVQKEADPGGVVPTSSSTAALAMGDALAVALMKKKSFGVKDFAFFHPRGETGKKLIQIRDLMHRGKKVPRVRPETPMREVLEEISSKKLGMTSVADEKDRLLGIITDGDLRRALQRFGKSFLDKKARDCMTKNPLTIEKNELATKALNLMEGNKITSLIVRGREGKIEGIIHLHDLWRTEMF